MARLDGSFRRRSLMKQVWESPPIDWEACSLPAGTWTLYGIGQRQSSRCKTGTYIRCLNQSQMQPRSGVDRSNPNGSVEMENADMKYRVEDHPLVDAVLSEGRARQRLQRRPNKRFVDAWSQKWTNIHTTQEAITGHLRSDVPVGGRLPLLR
jgi:hypothetical protein